MATINKPIDIIMEQEQQSRDVGTLGRWRLGGFRKIAILYDSSDRTNHWKGVPP